MHDTQPGIPTSPFRPSSVRLGQRPLRSSLFLLLLGAATLSACSLVTSPQSGGSTTGPGGGGAGGEGEALPVTCSWAKKTSDATCPAGECPIVLDEELSCDDNEFAAPGVRVAPAPDATWVATSSQNDRMVFRLADGKEERQEEVPKDFTRKVILLSLTTDGAVHLAADASEPDGQTSVVTYPGGLTHATFANGAWSSSVVVDPDDRGVPVIDMEIGSENRPHIWFVSDGPDGLTMATPDGQGGWAVSPETRGDRFTLAGDGSVIGVGLEPFASVAYKLHAVIGGVDKSFGSPLSDWSNFALATPPMPAAPSDLLFAVAIETLEGIRIMKASSALPETETLIAGTTAPVESCVTPLDVPSCKDTCHNTGSGVEYGAFSIAWTDDGTAWLAYVVTTVDQVIEYSVQGGPGEEHCVANVINDSSEGTLHLLRAPLDGSSPEEVLTMPIGRPGARDAFSGFYTSGRFLDMRGFAKDLAIGVRTGWVGGPHAVRVLRIDTTKL